MERLERLAAELFAMAEQIKRESDEPQVGTDEPAWVSRPGNVPPLLGREELLARWCGLAGELYQFRRRRERLFGPIFGEPAWDILLDLFVMEAKGRRVPVSSACIASGVSHSTALRQIDELVRRNLVMRERDEIDKRRTYLRLTEAGIRKLALALEQFARPAGTAAVGSFGSFTRETAERD